MEIIPTVVNADLSSFYSIQDESPGPDTICEIKEIFLDSIKELSLLKKRIIVLLMLGFEPKNIAKYLKTNEMAITRARRSFLASLQANGMEV